MDKLSRLFISRLKKDARRNARCNALSNGLLELKICNWESVFFWRYLPAFDTSQLSMQLDEDVAWFRQRFDSYLRPPEVKAEDSSSVSWATQRYPRKSSKPKSAKTGAGTNVVPLAATLGGCRDERGADARVEGLFGGYSDAASVERLNYAVRLIGKAGPAPTTSHVIAALLLARAIREGKIPFKAVLQKVSSTAPVVSIRSDTPDVSKRIVKLLEQVTLAGGKPWRFFDGRMSFDDDPYALEAGEIGRRCVHFAGHDMMHKVVDTTRRRLTNALAQDIPVLLTCDFPDDIPDFLLIGSDVELDITQFDRGLIQDTAEALYGDDGLAAVEKIPTCFEPHWLTMDDLLLAFRPDRSADDAVRAIITFAAMSRRAHEQDDGEVDGQDELFSNELLDTQRDTNRRTEKPAKEKSYSKRDKPSGAEVIQPEALDAREKADGKRKAPVTVETLSGYGRARDWAVGLKADLLEYLTDDLDWSDMSTKLLLSGPPGTGKTTFARALCNTLQVPLVVTSVSTWLEGGHLNDVIAKMAKTFEEAKALAPCVLFIDEFDGIGKRQPAEREHADYWNTVVNKALELLDGAVKAEGIIVIGATNRPDEIDEALRRSGRLETHIEIPRPDIPTLADILQHHLGDDVDRLLADAHAQASSTPASTDGQDTDGRTGNE